MALDLLSLQDRAERNRCNLKRDPGNCDVRLDLAWCMVLEALYYVVRGERIEDARRLVTSALRETRNVSLLSEESRQCSEADRIEFVCMLVVDQDALREADDRANRIVRRLATDMAAVTNETDRLQSARIGKKLQRTRRKPLAAPRVPAGRMQRIR